MVSSSVALLAGGAPAVGTTVCAATPLTGQSERSAHAGSRANPAGERACHEGLHRLPPT
jgi:hypothetical protein